jgi:hypothetical protein
MAMNTASQLDVSSEAVQHPTWPHIEHVLESNCFRASKRLRDFLTYVSDCALRDAPAEATEQQIGVRVFSRSAGYNPGDDNIVRSQARLLRLKLIEYYASEGIGDEIVIDVPKGHYLPVFHVRQLGLPQLSVPAPAEPPLEQRQLPETVPSLASPGGLLAPEQKPRSRLPVALLPLGLVLCIAAGFLVHPSKADPVDRFWASFLPADSTLVSFSNAVFTGDSHTGMRYADPAQQRVDPSPNLVETYTGVGELESVYDLTELFEQHHSHFLLKSSRLVTWDQARSSNLIFIGSIAENASLSVLSVGQDFTMRVGEGYAGFVNQRPRPGEATFYSRPEHPLTRDLAVITAQPGPTPGRKVLAFSGLGTLGTQAAVEFVCRRDTLDQLLKRVSGPNSEIRPFEALLETSIAGGVPIETQLLAVHVH